MRAFIIDRSYLLGVKGVGGAPLSAEQQDFFADDDTTHASANMVNALYKRGTFINTLNPLLLHWTRTLVLSAFLVILNNQF